MQPLIYHNPECGTSRNTLAMLKASGETPEIIEYLKDPPSRERLVWLLDAMAIPPRDLLRRKGTPYDELGLDDPTLSDEQLIEAMSFESKGPATCNNLRVSRKEGRSFRRAIPRCVKSALAPASPPARDAVCEIVAD